VKNSSRMWAADVLFQRYRDYPCTICGDRGVPFCEHREPQVELALAAHPKSRDLFGDEYEIYRFGRKFQQVAGELCASRHAINPSGIRNLPPAAPGDSNQLELGL